MEKTGFDPAGQKIIEEYLRYEEYVGSPDEEPLEQRLDFWPILDRGIDGVQHLMIGVDCDTGESVTLYATILQMPEGPKLETLVLTGDCVVEVLFNCGKTYKENDQGR